MMEYRKQKMAEFLAKLRVENELTKRTQAGEPSGLRLSASPRLQTLFNRRKKYLPLKSTGKISDEK